MLDFLLNCFLCRHDVDSEYFWPWLDSQMYPGVQPRPPDGALLPARERSGSVCHLHLGQEKEHKARLWQEQPIHWRPDAFRFQSGGVDAS